jgi:hypothetical protein
MCRDLDEFKNIEFLKGKHGRLLACGGMNSAVVTARAWVEDSEAKGCMACKGAFTFVNRRVCLTPLPPTPFPPTPPLSSFVHHSLTRVIVSHGMIASLS